MRGKGFLLIERHQLLYARVPKVANTAIKHVLAELLDDVDDTTALRPTNDRFWKACTRQAGFIRPDDYCDRYEELLSFTFIRDPLERLFSCYVDKIVDNQCRSQSFQRLGYCLGMSFEDFAALTISLDLDRMDVHTQPQDFLISDSKGRLPQFIGLAERMAQHWPQLVHRCRQRDIPLNPMLAQLHSKAHVKAGVNRQLSPSLLEDVQRFYGRDLLLHRRLSAASR